MNFPDFDSENPQVLWQRFCDLLWYDEDLGFWLDISRMNFSSSDLLGFTDQFENVVEAMKSLESGSIANQDESRQVGHYWLRNTSIAPSKSISNEIDKEINSIIDFANDVLDKKLLAPNSKPFTHVLWIGIGGSGLGPLLMTKALKKKNKGLDFLFLDNVDPNGMRATFDDLGSDILNSLIVTVSKSGSTPEPRMCMQQAKEHLNNMGGNWSKQAVAITMKDSNLDRLAIKEKWIKRFDLPDWVGGRTSITSSVGLLPGALLGIDINDFLLGASKMDQATREREAKNNPAALLAFSWYMAGKGQGKRDMVVLPYRDGLELFSRYLQQLVMESLGKKFNRNGAVVNQGLSVYGNKGSTDQHAYVQQLRDGIDNFFATFIEVLEDTESIQPIDGERTGDILSGFLQGTRAALTEGGRQSVSITMKALSPFSLGALIALFERAVGFYGELVNINAYHQPGVEAGKKAATSIIDLQAKIETLLSDGRSRSIADLHKELNNNSEEDIFWILRHIISNYKHYSINGSWKDPLSLTITNSLV